MEYLSNIANSVVDAAKYIAKPFIGRNDDEYYFKSSIEKLEEKHKNDAFKDMSLPRKLLGNFFPGKEEMRYEREKNIRHMKHLYENHNGKHGLININLNTSHSNNTPTFSKNIKNYNINDYDDDDDGLFSWFLPSKAKNKINKVIKNVKDDNVIQHHSFLRK